MTGSVKHPVALGEDVPGLLDCTLCERLVEYRNTLPLKGMRTRDDYWSLPVPGFGDAQARICLVGLAPGAHGANRTGRPFTGDGAGDFMYPLLHAAGLSNQAEAVALDDGLRLHDLYITNAVKCVPPENKPSTSEYASCLPYLEKELQSLVKLKVVILLGQGAYRSYFNQLRRRGVVKRLADFPFAHGAEYQFDKQPSVLSSYHTSRYNVQTGRITREMFLAILERARALATEEKP